MDRFLSVSATGDWAAAARTCADGLASIEPAESGTQHIGFFYVTDAMAPDTGSIATLLRQLTPISCWIGAVGSGVVADGREYHGNPALSVMVGTLPEQSFRLISGLSGDAGGLAGADLDWARRVTPAFGIIHGNPGYPDVVDAVERLSLDAGGELGGCFLLGGLAALPVPGAVIAGAEDGGALAGILFGPGTEVASALSQGCSPLGGVHRVTEANGDVIMSLDDRPALEVLKEDVGELLARDLSRLAGYVHAAFPVTGSDTGDYMVRNLLAIDKDRGWIGIGGTADYGDPLLFVRRDPESARTDLIRMVSRLKSRLPDSGIRGGLYFSCVARGPSLFGGPETESGIIQRELGPFPMAGFLGGGEISDARLYAYTGVLVLFC
ncbi:MAG: FIST C-terminal domain-containing protein [Rhodospirillales bacterium]